MGIVISLDFTFDRYSLILHHTLLDRFNFHKKVFLCFYCRNASLQDLLREFFDFDFIFVS